MEGRETGDLYIEISHLSDGGDPVRPSHLQLTIRWLILAAWVTGLVAAATNWTIAARALIPMGGVGGGDGEFSFYSGYDGSRMTVSRDYVTGMTRVHWSHPPTATGLCYVWWPSVAGGIITLVVLAPAATRNGRRLIAEFPFPPMTTRRLMIAVAVIGIEAVLIVSATRNFGGNPRSSRWPPIVFCLAVPPTLVFLPAFGRTRSAAAEKNSFGRKQ
jgi:hypothetical protein